MIPPELHARGPERPRGRQREIWRAGGSRHGEPGGGRGRELDDGVVQPGGAHDDFDGEGVALEGDVRVRGGEVGR